MSTRSLRIGGVLALGLVVLGKGTLLAQAALESRAATGAANAAATAAAPGKSDEARAPARSSISALHGEPGATGEPSAGGERGARHPGGAGKPGASPAASAVGEGLEPRALLESIARRGSELDRREHEVVAKEERLRHYERDVTSRIEALEALQKTLAEQSAALERAQNDRSRALATAEAAAADSLAKVYSAMDARQAAPLLDDLDEATALRIVKRMREKAVGEILPNMNRERAVVLTRALAAPR